MALDPRTHVLVAVSDRDVGTIVHDLIEEEFGCRVTVTSTVGDAFAVARSSLHPLLVVVDQTMFRMDSEGLVRLFTTHADEIPPMVWVALMSNNVLPDEVRAFLGAMDAFHLLTPFDVENDFLPAVERAALRLARQDMASETARP
jgi:CheY-like chemotaxis protein